MIRALRLDRSGASAAEFAMVLPLLVILLLGILDAGRLLWEVNRAEKATQVGARVAVVTDVLDDGMTAEDYVGQTVGGVTLTQGDLIPADALGEFQCTDTACTCISGTCPASGTFDTASFDLIVQRMQFMKPDIQPADVTVTYRGSGLGYAGDPNGMEVAPLVTVALTSQFRPLVLFGAGTVPLPTFQTTLTAEDSEGVQSN